MCSLVQEYNISMKNIPKCTDVEHMMFVFFQLFLCIHLKKKKEWGQSKD